MLELLHLPFLSGLAFIPYLMRTLNCNSAFSFLSPLLSLSAVQEKSIELRQHRLGCQAGLATKVLSPGPFWALVPSKGTEVGKDS